MNNYELFYLVSSSKTQEEVKAIIGQVNQILDRAKVKILHHEIWSQNKLAYPIKRVEQAFYILAFFETKAKTIAQLKEALLLSGNILRSIIVKHDNLEPQIKRFVEKQEPKRFPAKVSIDVAGVRKPKLPRSVMVPKPVMRTAPEKPEDKQVEVTKETTKSIRTKGGKKPGKKSSLAELDKKLEDILGGEIAL